MQRKKDGRVRQVVIGVSILITLSVVVTGTLLGWRLLPGLLGEWAGTVIGIATTPFFMEATFAILGLVIVILLNTWRHHKEGDEFVYLEQVAGPDVPKDMPEHAKWALYRERPLDSVTPSLQALAEGAFEIGDYEAAADWIGEMGQDELKQPETLRLRLSLAQATGRTDLAAQLAEEIQRSEATPF